MLEQLLARRNGSVQLRALGQNRAGEVRLGRFLHNKRVTSAEMIRTARTRTLARAAGRHVLAIQDTSSLRDASNTTRHSLHVHPTIAVDAQTGSLLGLVDAAFLKRTGGKRAKTNTRPFNDKQSRRWLDATVSAAGLAEAGAASVTMVADRECDIYEEFALRPPEVELVTRARHDRCLHDGTMLSRCLDGVAELGREPITLPAHPARKACEAVLSLRAKAVRIKAPKRTRATPGAMPDEVALCLVEARELEPPENATPAHWLLLTTHAVATLDDACRITAIYRQRWMIEQLFRTMKTKGFDIEAAQVEEGGPYEKLATATVIASIQVLQLVNERDGAAGQPLDDAFDVADQPAMATIGTTLEGKTQKQKNPHQPHTMAWASWICARLGGWNGYYGKPGPIVIHAGLLQLNTLLRGWRLREMCESRRNWWDC